MGSLSFEARGQTRRRPGPAAAFVKMLGFIVFAALADMRVGFCLLRFYRLTIVNCDVGGC
jgi:hypothetical protein